MKSIRRIGRILCVLLVAASCGQPPEKDAVGPRASASDGATDTPSSDPNQLYEAHAFVLDTPERGSELCLGGVEESLPPQCRGIPIAGWDWDEVEGEDSAGETRWGQFYVVGTFDGGLFTLREAGPPKSFEEPAADPIDTPCPEPAGGWSAADPSRASHEDVVDAQAKVADYPEFAGLWIDYYDQPPGGPTEQDPGKIILNVAFTGDLERHEQEVRELWGGPLCVTPATHTLKELEAIQKDFPSEEFGLEVWSSSIDVVEGKVHIAVTIADPDTLQRIDERYGEGVVEIDARLKPVE